MSNEWVLRYEGLDPKQEGLREALCTLGNGVFATRGAAEEQHAGPVSYPGTYVGGVYNQLSSEVAGQTVVNESLVNCPNWLWLTFRPTGGSWLNLWTAHVLEYAQELDLRNGVLTRAFLIGDERGRVTRLVSRRLVHMGKPNLAALWWELTPENWSGDAIIRTGIDGSVTNAGVARYRQLSGKHLEPIARSAVAPEGIFLKSRTSQSHVEIALAARTRALRDGEAADVERRILLDEPERIAEDLHTELRQGQPLHVEKVVSLFTSRDRGISDPGVAARLAIQRTPSYPVLYAQHTAAWANLWRRCDIEIEADHTGGPANDQLVVRLHVFHMLQTASPNTAGHDVGIPARGLHGEAYRGHIFWDELFVLPFYVQRLPSVARSALLYRYHRLDAARALAREAGCVGAAFPWQSGSDGREATQQLHLNPLSGHWDPDHSHLQRHVSSAVVYNAWRYYEATGDRAFLEDYGAELVLEIACFWSSLAARNPSSGRYEIEGVMGPDEYHEKYPGAEAGGLSNNAYTNVTAAWCLLRALDVLDEVSGERACELLSALEIDDDEIRRWEDITRRMTIPFHDGIISQFDGYQDLDELDWSGYAQRHGTIQRLDRILKAEGTTPDRFKASKQPDAIMLFHLFTPEELRGLFSRLGYEFDEEAARRNVEYYQTRTSHGSTLSKVIFTSVVHRQDCEAGCNLFLSALRSDLYDVQGGTTPEGVHLGAMGGTIDIVTRHYAGLELTQEAVMFAPDMPGRMRRLRFRFQRHGRWYDAVLTRDRLVVSVDDVEPHAVTVEVEGRRHVLEPGGSLKVDIEPFRADATSPGPRHR
jgi:trehalose/maltose hydrolase-like predicted phosphorylase